MIFRVGTEMDVIFVDFSREILSNNPPLMSKKLLILSFLDRNY